MSNKQKKHLLREKREEKKLDKANDSLSNGLKDGSILLVDKTKIFSHSCLPTVPDYYKDKEFVCMDCDSHQIWTAKQQKWWYEEARGEIESTAIRCRECRKKERLRKEETRKAHLEGLAKKSRSDKDNQQNA